MQSRLTPILNHPLFTVSVFLSSAVLGIVWYRAYASLRPPVISGWDWSKHPKTLVVWYAGSKGCACAVDLGGSVGKTVSAHGEVVILADQATIHQSDLARSLAEENVHVLPKEAVARPFWQDAGKTEMMWVDRGRITHRMMGVLLPDSVLTE